MPPTGEEPEGSAYTAVLLIQRHDGIVIPIVQGLNVSVHREATPHDILRMCADVKDQVAQTRGTGETLRHTRMMLSGLFPEAADAANARFEAAMKELEARAEMARAQAEQAGAYSESIGDELRSEAEDSCRGRVDSDRTWRGPDEGRAEGHSNARS